MTVSIRWPIILGSILLVWCTHLIIAPYSYVMSERVLTQHARDIMENISDLSLEQSYNHLNKAKSAAHLAKQLLSSDVFNSDDDENGNNSLERYFFDQLVIYPHLAGIYFGTQNGDFFYVSRNDKRKKGGFRTKIITNTPEGRTTKLIWRDYNYDYMGREFVENDTYDPRQRPWYKKVMKEKQIVWTSPYVFFTSQKPGVTIAGPAYNVHGSLKGIVGVDIEIDELSAFIDRLRVGKSGRAFILNRNRDVIAYHDVNRLTVAKEDAKGLRLPKHDELNDPLVTAAFGAIQWEYDAEGNFILDKSTSADYEVNGEQYICMFTPFPEDRLPWVIGVYVPEDDYLGAIKDNQLINAGSTIFVTILASWLAFLFARRIITPIENLQKEAKAIEEQDLKTSFDTDSGFSEIKETANSFTRMKQSLIKFKDSLREQEKVYRTITNTANDAIVMMDEDHKISYWNPTAEKVFGYTEDEVLGMDLYAALSPERHLKRYSAGLAQFDKDGTGPLMGTTVEVVARNKAGKELPVELSMARLKIGGAWHAAAIIRDITERKRNEEMKKRLVRDLHDGIGGNLANIKLLSEMAKSGGLGDSNTKALNSISEVADDCIAEIRNYMNVLDERSPTWHDVLTELRQYCGKTLEPHDISLEMNTSIAEGSDDPSSLMYMNLFKIVREAVTNVIKHAGATKVTIDVVVDEDNLTCTIADDGKSDNPNIGSGRGLLSMESRTTELGGTFKVTYRNGMTVTISAPLYMV